MDYITQYHRAIESGEIIVSKRVAAIYSKLHRDIQTHGEWRYDDAYAARAISFIEHFCKQSKGEWIGQAIELQLFQKAFISALFGFVDKIGIRRFKETFFLVARKNGKSTLLSGILLYMLVADGEGGAECYTVATKRDQARITFVEAVNMVRQSPDLTKHLKKRKTDIYFPLMYGKIEALASDSNSLDGLNSHCVVMDELHAIKDRNLYEVMKQSMSARRQPLMVMITTSGTVRECIYDDMYDYASQVADGIITDERFLPVLYELDSRDEWTDWRCWAKANPGLGTIKKLADITEKVERAKANPRDLPGILCKDFNIRDTVAGSWLTFEEVNNETATDIAGLADCYAIGGADLSSTTDLTAATLIVRKADGNLYVLQKYFIPEDMLEKKIREDKIPYDAWEKRGLVKLCEGTSINYSDVTSWYLEMRDKYKIHPLWIGYDPWGSKYWVAEMQTAGFVMEEVRQGAQTMSQPMKQLAAAFKSGKVTYDNNPVLKWCLCNTQIKMDENENIRPVKGKNQKLRIDGAVSLIDAYVVYSRHYEDYNNLM
ncbi:MAG: terminase large subunit [Eubacteriales bacterium]